MPEFLVLRNPEAMHGTLFFKSSDDVFLGKCQEHFKINFCSHSFTALALSTPSVFISLLYVSLMGCIEAVLYFAR